MSGNGPKKQRKGEMVTWDEAIAIAGSLDALQRIRDPHTVENWKSAGQVPAASLVSFFVVWWRARHGRDFTRALADLTAHYEAQREEIARVIGGSRTPPDTRRASPARKLRGGARG